MKKIIILAILIATLTSCWKDCTFYNMSNEDIIKEVKKCKEAGMWHEFNKVSWRGFCPRPKEVICSGYL